ncbi:MAG: RNase adapter RapZ [Thioalkalivibrionaceae bacterium]
MNLVVVSGLSGSGKSVALNALEDAGYLCIDNLPLRLVSALLDELSAQHNPSTAEASSTQTTSGAQGLRVAVGIDVRGGGNALTEYPAVHAILKSRGLSITTLFLHASLDTLLKRYHHTRRRHPLAMQGQSLAEAIAVERELLAPISAMADLQIDTDGLSMHQLTHRIRDRIVGQQPGQLSLLFQSFGFKYGAPIDADLVFDVRHLPNPHYEPGLAAQTGRDPDVIAYLERHDEVDRMFRSIDNYLGEWVPALLRDHRAYLTVGIGCTGGRHRSVYLAERLCQRWQALAGVTTDCRHREFEANHGEHSSSAAGSFASVQARSSAAQASQATAHTAAPNPTRETNDVN